MEIFTPRASSTSAAPLLLDTLLLPCFAIGTPAAAATIPLVVDMLNEFAQSPPVHTISRTSIPSCGSDSAWSLIPFALAVISSSVSPFM